MMTIETGDRRGLTQKSQQYASIFKGVKTFFASEGIDPSLLPKVTETLKSWFQRAEVNVSTQMMNHLVHILVVLAIVKVGREAGIPLPLTGTAKQWYSHVGRRPPRKILRTVHMALEKTGVSLPPLNPIDILSSTVRDIVSHLMASNAEVDLAQYLRNHVEPLACDLIRAVQSRWVGRGLTPRALVAAAIIQADNELDGRLQDHHDLVGEVLRVYSGNIPHWVSRLRDTASQAAG